MWNLNCSGLVCRLFVVFRWLCVEAIHQFMKGVRQWASNDFPRLLHSPRVAAGVIGDSKYRLRMPTTAVHAGYSWHVAMHCGLLWSLAISGILHRSLTVPCRAITAGKSPAEQATWLQLRLCTETDEQSVGFHILLLKEPAQPDSVQGKNRPCSDVSQPAKRVAFFCKNVVCYHDVLNILGKKEMIVIGHQIVFFSSSWNKKMILQFQWLCFNIKVVFPGIRISIIKIRQSHDCLTLIMEILMLVRSPQPLDLLVELWLLPNLFINILKSKQVASNFTDVYINLWLHLLWLGLIALSIITYK